MMESYGSIAPQPARRAAPLALFAASSDPDSQLPEWLSKGGLFFTTIAVLAGLNVLIVLSFPPWPEHGQLWRHN